MREAAEIAVRTIMQYPQMDVTMVCFDPVTREAYEAALENCLREAERRKNMEESAGHREAPGGVGHGKKKRDDGSECRLL